MIISSSEKTGISRKRGSFSSKTGRKDIIRTLSSKPNGKIWLREKDFSILKIEWDQSSMGNIIGIMEVAEKLKAKPHITFVSEYAYEKTAFAFPANIL